jgi:general stress protein 26
MNHEMSTSEAITKIWNLIRDVKIAMLTTVTPAGDLRSRPMATQEAEFDGNLWFLTSQQSGKVDEIEEGSRVSLTYVNNDAHAFVALAGRAKLSKDRERARELWTPMHAIWFPQGKDDPNIMVIKVTVEEAEYWESPGNALVRSYHLLKAMVKHDRSEVGEHERLAL